MIQPSSSSGFRPVLRFSIAFVLAFIVMLYLFYYTRPAEIYKKVRVKLPGNLGGLPELHMIGDSSMCKGGTNDGVPGLKYEGWGELVGDYFDIKVYDHAVSGRSSRMYEREGRFQKVLDHVKPGDYVIMQFGRNEKGDIKAKDNGKTACPGPDRDTICKSKFDDKPVDVLTYAGYMENAADAFKAKGCTVIVGAPTPNQPFLNSGRFMGKPTEWVGYTKLLAERSKITYIDHYNYVIDGFRTLGKNATEKLYPDPKDRIHTNREGADFIARSFLRGLMCGDSDLVQYMNQTTIGRIKDLGGCLEEPQETA